MCTYNGVHVQVLRSPCTHVYAILQIEEEMCENAGEDVCLLGTVRLHTQKYLVGSSFSRNHCPCAPDEQPSHRAWFQRSLCMPGPRWAFGQCLPQRHLPNPTMGHVMEGCLWKMKDAPAPLPSRRLTSPQVLRGVMQAQTLQHPGQQALGSTWHSQGEKKNHKGRGWYQRQQRPLPACQHILLSTVQSPSVLWGKLLRLETMETHK